jgi:SanA protein
MKKKKIFWVLSISIILTIITTIWLANRKIDEIAKDSVYNEVSKIPYNKVGLLLGTSKTLSSGEENLYFMNRIVAVNELFKAHKFLTS